LHHENEHRENDDAKGMRVSEIASIARLLADPDPGVVVALRRQLALRDDDPPGLRDAIEALADPADRARAREARLEVGRERAAERLVRLATSLGDAGEKRRARRRRLDLEEGAFEIARLEDPDADVAAARRALDELGARARARIAAERPGRRSRERLVLLARLLGGDEGFVGDREEANMPRNTSLAEVLERKRGLPIALSVVYLLVGARAGVALFGVGAPLHFLVGGQTEDGPLYLDPFAKGRLLGAREVGAMLALMGVSFRPEQLAPTPVREILARMARNLVAFYARRARGEARAQRYARLAIALEPAP
jgi:regulator of sirC expression with transglutaminase-like and TPR domain